MSSRYERLLWSAEQAKNRDEAQRVLAEEMLMRATEVLEAPVAEDPASAIKSKEASASGVED